jgi:hypothetical protein
MKMMFKWYMVLMMVLAIVFVRAQDDDVDQEGDEHELDVGDTEIISDPTLVPQMMDEDHDIDEDDEDDGAEELRLVKRSGFGRMSGVRGGVRVRSTGGRRRRGYSRRPRGSSRRHSSSRVIAGGRRINGRRIH